MSLSLYNWVEMYEQGAHNALPTAPTRVIEAEHSRRLYRVKYLTEFGVLNVTARSYPAPRTIGGVVAETEITLDHVRVGNLSKYALDGRVIVVMKNGVFEHRIIDVVKYGAPSTANWRQPTMSDTQEKLFAPTALAIAQQVHQSVPAGVDFTTLEAVERLQYDGGKNIRKSTGVNFVKQMVANLDTLAPQVLAAATP